MSETNRYTIRDPNARRVCNLAGLSVAKQKLVTLRELKKGIDVSLQELEAQRKKDLFAEKAFLTLKMTKATCDAFISLAAEFTVVLGKPAHEAAQKVKGGYVAGSAVADAVGTAAAGGKVDFVKTGAGIAKGASEFVGDEGIKYAIKNGAVKTEIVVSALNNDQKGVIKGSIEYGMDLGKFTTESLKPEGSGENVTKHDKASALAGIVYESTAYKDSLDIIFEEILSFKEENSERYLSLKSQFVRQAKKFQCKIDEVEEFIKLCSEELGL